MKTKVNGNANDVQIRHNKNYYPVHSPNAAFDPVPVRKRNNAFISTRAEVHVDQFPRTLHSVTRCLSSRLVARLRALKLK